jgi:hypothetical protein
MKIKTSQLYKVIQEELEVVIEGRFDELKKAQKMLQTSQQFFINLAQELEVDGQLIGEFKEASIGLVEAVFKANYQRTGGKIDEIFDLDMSALLDEMMNEVDLRPEFIKDLGMRNVELCKQKAAGNMAAQCDEEKLKKYLAHQGKELDAADRLATPTERVKQLRRKRREAREGGAVGDAVELQEKEDKSFSKAAKEIEKKGTEGVFTAKADKAGMGVQAYAAKVLKKGSKASTKTKRQAAFAKGAATVARENK